eukprot:11717840-Ditylum_brightwellii.AAC.1
MEKQILSKEQNFNVLVEFFNGQGTNLMFRVSSSQQAQQSAKHPLTTARDTISSSKIRIRHFQLKQKSSTQQQQLNHGI